MGRPPKAGKDRIQFFETELHDWLRDQFPEFVRGGRIEPKALSEALSLSTFRVYEMLKQNKVSIQTASRIIELSDPEKNERPSGARAVTREELVEFLPWSV